ncbi:MAG: malonyl-CoA synthase [Pseudomonadota bacterium]|nr:malonyl-CoA synthase [Pseudomonadota bacterium]
MTSNNMLFDQLFAAHQDSEKIFLHTVQTDYSYAQFHQLVNQLANALLQTGLKTGDRVAVQAAKSVTQLALYVATIKAGGVYLPLNTSYTAFELDYFITNADASIVVVSDKAEADIAPITTRQNARLLTLNADETGSLTAIASKSDTRFEAVSRGPEDLAAILYTSGTTGRSKGAQLCHRNLVSNTLVLRDFWQFTSDDVLLHMLPIYHTHGLFVACNLLAFVGGSMIFLPRFDADHAVQYIKKATTMMGVPTFYTRLLDDSRFDAGLSNHMRLFISGSAPLLAETHKQFEARTGKQILERYGMIETNMSTSNPYDGARIAGTVGVPLPGVELRIADPKTGEELADGEIGIIELKGDNVFTGYWQMPEKTAESFRDDGYFITGDMARIDENGYVVIVGRDKDLIISGGLNIYPKEIESLIDTIDGVVESAVIGAPHPDFGEGVVAVIVTAEAGLTDADIMAFLADKLAKFKQPKTCIFVEELPRNTMGKVQKAALRERHQQIFNTSS